MAHFFWDTLNIFVFEFIRFSKKRVEWLAWIPLAKSWLRYHEHTDESQSLSRIIYNLASSVQDIIVLERLCKLLNEACWVIQIDRKWNFRQIFAFILFYDRVDAKTRCIFILKPWQLCSFFRLLCSHWLHPLEVLSHYFFILRVNVLIIVSNTEKLRLLVLQWRPSDSLRPLVNLDWLERNIWLLQRNRSLHLVINWLKLVWVRQVETFWEMLMDNMISIYILWDNIRLRVFNMV